MAPVLLDGSIPAWLVLGCAAGVSVYGLITQGGASVKAIAVSGIFGLMAWAALRLEELWNDLQRERQFSLLCAYVLASFFKEPEAIRAVCSMSAFMASTSAALG